MTLQWGYKLVGTDLTTDDHQGGRYRYRLGEWHEAPGPFTTSDLCPSHPGDGLCVARTLSGAQSGGARLGSSVMLLVGYEPDDVLAEASDKLRVKRLFVHPDPLDPVATITGPGANLGGTYLRDADLRGANLRDANLRGANLRDADLRGADLRGADLGGAYLRDANLRGADLGGADLGGADLGGANLGGTYLRDADLGGADLGGADLRDADLGGADLGGAYLRGANLGGAYLRGAYLRGADLGGADRPSWLPAEWTVTDNGFIAEEHQP